MDDRGGRILREGTFFSRSLGSPSQYCGVMRLGQDAGHDFTYFTVLVRSTDRNGSTRVRASRMNFAFIGTCLSLSVIALARSTIA